MNKGYGSACRPVPCPLARGVAVLGGHPADGADGVLSFAGLVRQQRGSARGRDGPDPGAQ
ncbi:hypothetical protein ACH4S8_16410 [Streptomyces sp. NPDC021080]|uniref:hypothetical protein n=1 Tax=Streptomyces sp. NPDC021080 TaxID=3365110 RepID=UPI00379C554A